LTITVENVQLARAQVGSLAAGRYVKLTLADTGTGMPPDVVARAVEPFFTTKPIGEGTGLGLSQAYGLVQQSGGDLQIESQPGTGTRVSLYWPALELSADESTSSADTNAGAEKALVVDDQPDVLETMVELLRTMGYEVLPANNAAEALETLDRHGHISVLLSDVVMAGMDGVTLAREVRKRCPAAKVILVSGFPRDNLKDQHGDLASFGFLMKPFRMAELAKLLRQAS
jgi:CheY-like chemotaxis protein